MTNSETVDLCEKLGVPVKSHSSSLNEAYSDMVRRRAEREGLTRDEQPEEPKPVKKSAAAMSRVAPPAPVATSVASSAKRTAGRSAAGSEWASEPPMVPRLRTC